MINELFFKEIEKLDNLTWTPSINLFTGLLWDELLHLAGYRPKTGRLNLKEREQIAKQNYEKHKQEVKPETAPYPNSFSWMDVNGKNYMTPVKNQGFCSSCSAFGSVAATETLNLIKGNREKILSEAQVFFKSPGFSKEDRPETHNCRTGWPAVDALDYMTATGALPESEYPYDLEDKFQKLPAGWEKNTTKITGYVALKTHTEMKSWLANRGPLVGAMTVHADFILYGKGIYKHIIGPEMGGHCITIIGYNDDYQAWLCKNSWSEHWGENGYFWIAYGQCGVGSEMWGIEDIAK